MPEDFDPPALSSDPELEALLERNARSGFCPPPDLLLAADADVLPASAGAAIRAHSAQCRLCQALLEGLAPAESALTPGQKARIRGRVEAGIEAATPARTAMVSLTRKPSVWDFAPIAAILVLALGSFLLFRWAHRPAATETAAKPAVAAAPQPPVELSDLRQVPPLPEPEDVALTIRGGGAAPSGAELLPAFRAYNRGDFATAAAGFARLAKRFPNADVPALYLGVSQLELNRIADARKTLTHARKVASTTRSAAANWYLAVATLRTGDTQAAAPLLHSVCDATQSSYSVRACALAAQLGQK